MDVDAAHGGREGDRVEERRALRLGPRGREDGDDGDVAGERGGGVLRAGVGEGAPDEVREEERFVGAEEQRWGEEGFASVLC